MNTICAEILGIIEDYNKRDEEIYMKKLAELFGKRATESTVHKWVRYLVDLGHLREVAVTHEKRICKYLYVPGSDEKTSVEEMLYEMNRKIDILIRILRERK